MGLGQDWRKARDANHRKTTGDQYIDIRHPSSGAKLLDPEGVEIVQHMLLVEDPDSGMYGSKDIIPPRSIGRVSVHFIVMLVTGTPGRTLPAQILILDQFGNEHPVDLECKFIGPETI